MTDEKTLLQEMADFLHKLKDNRAVWEGRTGLTCSMREDVNDLLAEHRKLESKHD